MIFFWSESVVYFQRRCRLKFLLPYGSMLTKTKKKNNNKFSKPKTGLEIWWGGTFSKNLASIRLTFSEKMAFTD